MRTLLVFAATSIGILFGWLTSPGTVYIHRPDTENIPTYQCRSGDVIVVEPDSWIGRRVKVICSGEVK